MVVGADRLEAELQGSSVVGPDAKRVCAGFNGLVAEIAERVSAHENGSARYVWTSVCHEPCHHARYHEPCEHTFTHTANVRWR